MRDERGIEAILESIDLMEKSHEFHLRFYGLENEKRLIGKHETASIKEFKSGVGD